VSGPRQDARVVELKDVWCSRGRTAVLRGVSLTLATAETVALVGRSGAGKSTLLKLINKLLLPDRGDVLVAGRATADWNPFELRRRIGYVQQDVGLFPHMSVADNVAIVPRLLEWETSRVAARVDEMLELVGLTAADFRSRRPHELSGGQKQRVGVARALAADPPILLMDEPFGSLDPITRAELHAEFRLIQERVGKTIVLVTHDMAEAFALATRIAVLADGEFAIVDTPRGVARATDPRVRTLLAPLFEASAALEGAR
jgi:osmoprotectant transport system ATP-binding protein